MKHVRSDTNYPILTKRIRLQHEKKPVLNSKSVESVGFEQTFPNFLRFSFRKINVFTSKNRSGNHFSGHH